MALAAVQALQSKLVACHGRHGSCHCCAVHAVTAAAFKVSTVCSVHSCAKLAHLTRVPLYRRYVDYLLGALSRRELFCWLSLSPSKFWHTLLLRDRWAAGGCQQQFVKSDSVVRVPPPHTPSPPNHHHHHTHTNSHTISLSHVPAKQVQLPGSGCRGAAGAAKRPGCRSCPPNQRRGGRLRTCCFGGTFTGEAGGGVQRQYGASDGNGPAVQLRS
jgi:hypothetical protein